MLQLQVVVILSVHGLANIILSVVSFRPFHENTHGSHGGSRLGHYPTSRKVEGSSPDEVDFISVYLFLPVTLWPWFRSPSDRNKYREILGGGVKGGGCVRLKKCEPIV
jgi:hypothetical protein